MENQDVQLLKDYSDTEKGAYLGAIASIASADREASAQEMEFLTKLCQTAALSPEETQAVLGAAKDPQNLSVEKCLDALKNSELRYSFITDIMGFAKADGVFSGEEEARIKQMSDYLGVNEQQYGALKNLVNVADASVQQGEVVAPQALAGAPAGENSGIGDMLKNAGIPTNGLMKGILGVAAPLLIAKVLGGSRGGGSQRGGGLLGGLAGSVLGGGMGKVMGGNSGLGSVMGGLGGLLGGGRGGMLGGGLGSILGSVLGGRR